MRRGYKLLRLRRYCSSVSSGDPSAGNSLVPAAAVPGNEENGTRKPPGLRGLSLNPIISDKPIASPAVSRFNKMSLTFETRELLEIYEKSSDEGDWNRKLRVYYGKITEYVVDEVLTHVNNAEAIVHFFFWLDGHPEFKHRRFTLNRAIEALVKLRQTKRANELLLNYTKPLKLNAFTFAGLIRGYCDEGNVDRAFQLLGEMKRDNIRPNIRSYNLVLKHLCDRGYAKKAWELLHSMVSSPLCTPNVYTYNTLIGALCKMGRLDDAEGLVNLMESRGCSPDMVTMNTIIHGLCKNFKTTKAIKLLDDAVGKGYRPTTYTYTIVIDTLLRRNHFDDAQRYLDQMYKQGCAFDTVTYNMLINRFCRSGMMDKAMELFGKMSSSGCLPDVVTYNSLIHGWSKAGKIDEAHKLFKDMKLVAVWPNAVTYTTIIDGFFQAGKVQDAHRYLVEIREKGGTFFDQIAYFSLISSIAKLGKGYLAYQLLQEMIVKGYTPNLVLYSTVAAALKRSGCIEEANQVILMTRKIQMKAGPVFIVDDNKGTKVMEKNATERPTEGSE